MKKFFVIAFAFGLLSLPLIAQDKVEVFGGYQYLHIGTNTSAGINSGQGFNGWNAAAAYNFNKNLGVEGDFSGTYAKVSGVSFHIYTYTGGPVVSMNTGKIKPFAHVLFGGAQLTGSAQGASVTFNGFTTMVGGGVDAKVNKVLAIRLAQFDWLYYHFGSKTIAGTTVPSFSGSNNVRISTGVVLRF
jgi:hypothetical protein